MWLLISDNLSLSLALRYVYSNLASGQESSGVLIKPGHAAATDISTYYQNSTEIDAYKADYAFGASIVMISLVYPVPFLRNKNQLKIAAVERSRASNYHVP